MKPININLLLISIFIITVMGLFINKLTTPRTLSNNELLVNGLFLFEKPKQISDFEFFSSNNRSFTKEDLLGKWTVMYFGFSRCPDECPTTMYELSKLVKILREKNYDLDKYAKGFDDDFMGVSNERPMLLNLATQLSVNNVMPSSNHNMDHSHLDNHVNSIILLNPKGEYAGLFRPPFSTSRLSLTYQSVTQD